MQIILRIFAFSRIHESRYIFEFCHILRKYRNILFHIQLIDVNSVQQIKLIYNLFKRKYWLFRDLEEVNLNTSNYPISIDLDDIIIPNFHTKYVKIQDIVSGPAFPCNNRLHFAKVTQNLLYLNVATCKCSIQSTADVRRRSIIICYF